MNYVVCIIFCLFALQQHCTALNLNEIKEDSIFRKRMAFLVSDTCETKSNVLGIMVNLDKVVRGDWLFKDNDACANMIGFMPITDTKVEIFVSAQKKLKIQSVECTVQSISLSYTYKSDNNHVSKDVLKCESNTVKGGNILNIFDKTEIVDILQCDSTSLEHSTEQNIFSGTTKWKMDIKCGKKDNTIEDIKMEGSLDDDEISEKKTCDPDKLVTKISSIVHSSIEKDYKEVEKYVDSQYAIVEFFKTNVTQHSCQLNDYYNLVYSLNNEEEKIAKGVQCESAKYSITLLDGQTISTSASDKIEVRCVRYKCRSCFKHITRSDTRFPGDMNITDVKHDKQQVVDNDKSTHENFKKCFTLNTDECPVLVHNDEVINKKPYGKAICSTDGTYQLNGRPVNFIGCSDKFSASWNILNTAVPANLKLVKTVEVRNCYTNTTKGCECVEAINNEQPRLAIAKQDGSTWLRVNSIRFNSTNNTWIYSRNVKNPSDNGQISEKEFVLETNRSVGCVQASSAYRNGPDENPNPAKPVVFAVNIALIFVIVGITIPSTIFYVNTRVKKREALKAAKKDKKKEDQSGDKKDGEEKKNEEKKNEA